ncbi:MAG: RHS repeat domain-containing protein [Ferruginibacter sp.]
MKTIYIIAMACLLLPGPGCKKSESTTAVGDRLVSLTVKKLITNSISYTRKYTYDASGNLITLDHASGENIYTFSYNSQGRLQSVKLVQSLTTDIMINSFVYDVTGKIIRKTGTPLLPNLEIDDHTYGYDGIGRLVADNQHYRQTATISGYRAFVYDDNDDISEQRFFFVDASGTATLEGGIAYTYDYKLNPFNKIRVPSYMTNEDIFYLSKHNVVSTTAISGPGQYLTPTIYTYTNIDLPQTATFGTPADTNWERWEFSYE